MHGLVQQIDYLVTGNDDFLVLEGAGLRIFSPGQFLDILRDRGLLKV